MTDLAEKRGLRFEKGRYMMILTNYCNSNGSNWKKREKESKKIVIKYRSYFTPANKQNEIWFFIITHHLYIPYKYARRIAKRVLKGEV